MSGLFSLLDDVAALAKIAAASLDDVAAATGKASAKAVGVIVDDTAVTPQYLTGVSPERELPIIRKIARGSLRNKVLIILPAALLLSQFAPFLLPPLMILGGSYLAFEGMEKVIDKIFPSLTHSHQPVDSRPNSNAQTAKSLSPTSNITNVNVPASSLPPTDTPIDNNENLIIRNAVRTDLILSAEIMVIALNEVASQGIIARSIILILVAFLITFLVYAVVALLVKMDDFGLMLAHRSTTTSKRIGAGIIRIMPKILSIISVVGVFAMVWVGGHIVAVSIAEVGWHWPHHLIESASVALGNLAAHNHLLATSLAAVGETGAALLAGALWGTLLVFMVIGAQKGAKLFHSHN